MPEPIPFDIPLILQVICPLADWGPHANTHDTYENLARSWRDPNHPCPTLAEMQAVAATLKPPVPQIVSRWRLRRALRATPFNGTTLFQAVTEAIAASGNVDLSEQWEDVTEIVRDSAVIAQLAAGLNIPPELIDDIFRLAGSHPR